MSLYRRGDVWWTKFMHRGKMIYRSTGTGNVKEARTIEARIRSEIALGNFGILKQAPGMTLACFFERHFLPWVKTTFASNEPNTYLYYNYGAKHLLSHMPDVALADITGEHATGVASRYASLSPSTVNRALRTLRRALRLAVDWKKLSAAPKVPLITKEHKRERVVKDSEFTTYLSYCKQPWHDIAVLIRGTGVRPNEAYTLRWENVLFEGERSCIQITKGKTPAARRLLPMVSEVAYVLKLRHQDQGRPESGWVFPMPTASGHADQSGCSYWHRRALRLSGVEHFEPYCLRHTALTRLAESGCDSFTLAKIAGHTSITMTQRYVHPQAEAIELAFQRAPQPRLRAGEKPGDITGDIRPSKPRKTAPVAASKG